VRDGHLLGDRPQERQNLPRDRRDDDVRVLAARNQAPIAFAEPHLGLPRDVLDGLGTVLEPQLQVRRYLGRVPIRPRGFNQRPARVAVAGLRDGPESTRLAGRVLARDQSDERGELPWRIEAGQVSAHLAAKVASEPSCSRRGLTLVPARNGLCYHRDAQENYWRTYLFIESALTYDAVESPRQAFEAARPGALALMTVVENAGRWDKSNVRFESGRIIDYDKAATSPGYRHADYGLGLLAHAAFDGEPQARFDLAGLYRRLVMQGRLAGHDTGQRFWEIGSAAGLEEARVRIAETLRVDLARNQKYKFFEYACHEGNYLTMQGIIGARQPIP